jgi:hypothetical protein
MDRLRASWKMIDATFLGLGFTAVELDPSGYRRGGLLTIAPRLAH